MAMTGGAFNLAHECRLTCHIWLSAICLLAIWALWSYLSSPLRKYPGPFLASKEPRPRRVHVTQHGPYGPSVGPTANPLSLSLSLCRMDQPLEIVSHLTRQLSYRARGAAPTVWSRGADRPERAGLGFARGDQDDLQHQGRLEEGRRLASTRPNRAARDFSLTFLLDRLLPCQ